MVAGEDPFKYKLSKDGDKVVVNCKKCKNYKMLVEGGFKKAFWQKIDPQGHLTWSFQVLVE